MSAGSTWMTAKTSPGIEELLAMAQVVEKTTAEEENTFHYYTGNAIPWFVRAIWILFWCGAIAYVIAWLLPALQTELTAPP
jgi:hypothetical protein